MIEVPHEVLSEHLQSRLRGRRLLQAVFTTFQFEPGFFEQEVLPVFLDSNLGQAPALRLVQLEQELRTRQVGIAVYYDANGLIASEEGSAKLDTVRIPVRHKTGIFHSKTIFALVEATEPDEDGHRPRALLVAVMSANLTRAGWWKNVEACHVEELEERGTSRLRDGLLEFIASIKRRAPDGVDHSALEVIREFVLATEQHVHRKVDGVLQAHFFGGTQSLVEFLEDTALAELRDLNLEVISPYVDKVAESEPLKALLRRFKPRETRVYLPRNSAGDALVPEEMYAWVRELEDEAVAWGKLPAPLLRASNNDAIPPRTVHAKVYRFFSAHPKREFLVIGSVNLTTPAHQTGGNVEAAVLIEVKPERRPDFWLDVDSTKPKAFGAPEDFDGDLAASTAGARLSIRYDWASSTASVYWDDPEASPPLRCYSNGIEVLAVAVPSRTWTQLEDTGALAIRGVLDTTSFVEVRGDRPDPVLVLVMEEGMWRKPPMITRLSLQDILRYWSLLTVEQRNEFLASRAITLLGDAALGALVAQTSRTIQLETIFDRFAGFFHAFECRYKNITKALEEGREKEALYLLFGVQYDSLGALLARLREEVDRDLVDRYVIALAAKQLCDDVKRDFREFWDAHAVQVAQLEAALGVLDELRAELVAGDPSQMRGFVEWFERPFLKRAKSLQVAS